MTVTPEWPQLPPDLTFKGLGSIQETFYADATTTRVVDEDDAEVAQLELWGEAVKHFGVVSEGDILTIDLGDGARRWLVTNVGLSAGDNDVIHMVPVQEGDD